MTKYKIKYRWHCEGYDGKYRPTAYTMKRAARKLMRKARTRNGDWFAYYCGKEGQAYKCAIEFNDGEITIYNLGTFEELGHLIPPHFRELPPIKNGMYKGGMGKLHRG